MNLQFTLTPHQQPTKPSPTDKHQLAGPLLEAQRAMWIRRAEQHRQDTRDGISDLQGFKLPEFDAKQLPKGLSDPFVEIVGSDYIDELLPGPASQPLLAAIDNNVFGLQSKQVFPRAFGFDLTPQQQFDKLSSSYSLMIEPT